MDKAKTSQRYREAGEEYSASHHVWSLTLAGCQWGDSEETSLATRQMCHDTRDARAGLKERVGCIPLSGAVNPSKLLATTGQHLLDTQDL